MNLPNLTQTSHRLHEIEKSREANVKLKEKQKTSKPGRSYKSQVLILWYSIWSRARMNLVFKLAKKNQADLTNLRKPWSKRRPPPSGQVQK